MQAAYIQVEFDDSTAVITMTAPGGVEVRQVASTIEEANATVLSYILENFPTPTAEPKPEANVELPVYDSEGGAGDVDTSQR